MRRSRRLLPVVEIARRKACEGARALAYIQQKLQTEQAQLQQLHTYLEEYRASIQQQGVAGVTVQHLRLYHDFSHNVERAIEQQGRQVQVVAGQVEQIRHHWQQLDARHKGLEKLQQRLLKDEERLAERQSQKEQDEFCNRMRKPTWS